MSVKLCLVFVVVLLAIDESYCHQKYIFGESFHNFMIMTDNYVKSFKQMDWNSIEEESNRKIKQSINEIKESIGSVDQFVRNTQSTDSMDQKSAFKPLDDCKQYLRTHDRTNPGVIGHKCLRFCQSISEIGHMIYTYIDLHS